ncbi:hypothetical protein G3M48_002794 [Beauveria asiatica]|uniref:Uncharacterized protein n=1 Tax=Beauveria asiatica TaxID=1069075 RepID=A0AAW0RX81_9HYPO
MQTNSILVSFLASGLSVAALQSYADPADCTPSSVAYMTPVHTSTVQVAPETTSMGIDKYDTPSGPYVSPQMEHTSNVPMQHTSNAPMEQTPSPSHVTVHQSESPDWTTSSYPYQYTGMHTSNSPQSTITGAFKTSKVVTTAAPTYYNPVQSTANRMGAQGLFIATVVAGLLFM